MSLPAAYDQINRRLGVMIWTTRDGREIPLDELSARHIDNALAVLIPWRRDCRKRGERQMMIVLGDTIRILRRERRKR
jgi:hypothetical protein